MNDDLDEKLNTILTGIYYGLNGHSTLGVPEAAREIKQAFKEAGYFKQHTSSPEAFAELNQNMNEHLPTLMTGPEWLARFEKELKTHYHRESAGTWYYASDILEAAKKAARVE